MRSSPDDRPLHMISFHVPRSLRSTCADPSPYKHARLLVSPQHFSPSYHVVRARSHPAVILFSVVNSIHSSLLTTIGLRATPGEPVPNHAVAVLLANWFFAYGVMSTRVDKVRYGIDNNVAPREDLSKYGEAAVQAGKLDRRTLNKLKRQEAAHANAVEGYPFIVAASKCLTPG